MNENLEKYVREHEPNICQICVMKDGNEVFSKEWALSRPGVKGITAETEETNTASRKVLQKAGFVLTGEKGREGLLWLSDGGKAHKPLQGGS